MKITGGRYCGRTVACPPGALRPAMARMRESMFSILNDINGLSFLDLFAGSGIMALEALSRGVNKTVLVEKDRRKRKVIMENLKIAMQDSKEGQITLKIRPVEHFLKAGIDRFDVVYCDPPFRLKHKMRVLTLAENAGLPSCGGTLIIHYPSVDTPPNRLAELRCYDQRYYGQSQLAFYTRDR